MAALHEDMTADEELLNRPLRNPVSPLLSSFKWAADSVASLVDLDPAICVELCKIERAQMHVVALVLAHLEVESTPELGRLLLCGSIRRVITETLGRDLPAGLGRAVARMPAKVLAQENYRRLIALLDHRPTTKLLFHSDAIDDALIDLLFQTPPHVRRHVMQLAQSRGEYWSQYAGLGEGLHVLVTRGAADNFEELVCTLASAKRPEQFLAKLRSVCDSLPLPEAMPSVQMGLARPLDSVSEFRRSPLDGRIAFAITSRPLIAVGARSISGTMRRHRLRVWSGGHGPLGWFLDDVRGPRNVEIGSLDLT